MDRKDSRVVIRVSELIGKEVVAESGWSLGYVFDIRVELGKGDPKVVGVVVGAPGLMQHLHGESQRRDPTTRTQGTVPWDAVVAIEDKVIRVRDVASPEEEGEES
jgi:sporulation protein YlmC with PRC-barrel domain